MSLPSRVSHCTGYKFFPWPTGPFKTLDFSPLDIVLLAHSAQATLVVFPMFK